MSTPSIEQLRQWYANSDPGAPIEEIGEAIAAYDALQSQLTQAQESVRELQAQWNDLRTYSKELESQLTTAHKERDELSARCAVMREALEVLSKLGNEPLRGNSKGNEIAAKALDSTAAGTALLARLKEAEWLLQNVPETFDPNYAKYGWNNRCDQWLKEGAK